MHCNFQIDTVYIDTMYACVLKNFTTSFRDRKIVEVTGNHESGKNNSDVKMLYAYHQNIPYLPNNLGDFFPNLESYFVMRSNVQHLIPGDLNGLDNLVHFSVVRNPIELIEQGFFSNHTEMTLISFSDCHLKKIERGAFDGLHSIKYLNLDSNDCISKIYGSYRYDLRSRPIQLLEFLTDAYDKCTGVGRMLKLQEVIKDCSIKEGTTLTDSLSVFCKLGITVICFLFSIDVFLIFMIVAIYRRNSQYIWIAKFNWNGQ